MAASKAFPQATAGQTPAPETLLRIFWRRYRRNSMALVGLVLVILFVILALFAPLIAPYHYDAQNLAQTWQAPSAEHLFGTDDLGRDQLSRIIYAVRTAA